MPSKDELKILQAYPLDLKIKKTQARIREWVDYYGTDGVYVSFSGGKDSTVLLYVVRQMYPDIEAVFVNTGLEYPEIQSFVKSFDNVTILRPKMRFDEVIRKYGYPFISKPVSNCVGLARENIKDHKYTLRLRLLGVKQGEYGGLIKDNNFDYEKTASGSLYEKKKYRPLLDVDFKISSLCCDVMKKEPAHQYSKETGKVPILATITDESILRKTKWLKNGCNSFEAKNPDSAPLSFWTNQDILRYIKENNLPIASVYGDIVYGKKGYEQYDNLICDCGSKLCTTKCDRTGCVYCAYGAQEEKGESRFERLKKTHPRQYEYCMGGGAYDTDGLWKPTKEGLGMAHCIDELNKIYGKNFIRY